ncbi:hypothetical protein [Paenibacillus sp. ISL-20]|uniref:hypothetical protein n=1 Tax=Paenibacillus sp. ISL-20 TaxID=2819163 RepID=UPI001BE8875E|nr:hypothetical protein [Paenibacillus sp. ISL-20]MBT2759880.1 hypothetical protein [Paenibacillus sp. ISL-20]
MFKGWISIPSDVNPKEEQEQLNNQGIEVGFFCEEDCKFYDCTVSEKGMNELIDNYGYYEWDLV